MKLAFRDFSSFSVLGREGSTEDGPGFIQGLWQAANEHFQEIAPYVLFEKSGAPQRLWGLMSDPTRSLAPWEDDFSRGLYLAGAQCRPDAPVPDGWAKWDVPALRMAVVPVQGDPGAAFREGLVFLEREGLKMAAAAFDMTVPAEGASYVCFPVERL